MFAGGVGQTRIHGQRLKSLFGSFLIDQLHDLFLTGGIKRPRGFPNGGIRWSRLRSTRRWRRSFARNPAILKLLQNGGIVIERQVGAGLRVLHSNTEVLDVVVGSKDHTL